MDELIQAMSNEDLVNLKNKHTDVPSLATLIDGILEARGRELAQLAAITKFENGIAKFFNGRDKNGKFIGLVHPDNIHKG